MSGAVALCDHLKDWVHGTKPGEFVSMGVYSDGKHYGIPEDLFYSFPVICKNGDYEIVEDLELNEL